MKLAFTKMHGLGNDFIVIDLVTQRYFLSEKQIRWLCDRHFGIGCDQLLTVEPPESPDVDFRYRIYNADGSEVEQCGNGARCFARFVQDKKLSLARKLKVQTLGGIIELEHLRNKQVKVNMGIPEFEPEKIPFLAEQRQENYEISSSDGIIQIGAVSMGNPHAVIQVDSVETAPLDTLGPEIESHEKFPNRVNVGFMQVLKDDEIQLRVFERGVGETLACGSGACAAVASGFVQGLVGGRVKVHLPGGYLFINWEGEGEPLYMIGPAYTVYDGFINL